MAKTRLAKVVLTIKGVWSPTVEYEKLDLVNYLGSSYIAKRDNIGVTPVEGDDWSLSAEKGGRGDQGDKIYLHIAYANSEDGETDFTTSPAVDKVYTYLGSYSDYTQGGSTVPSKYVWSKLSEEAARAAAELLRVTAENKRVTAETARTSAESSRDSAESARNTAEETRVSNEQSRVSAETNRVSEESARQSAETVRDSSETDRQKAEVSRVDEEKRRVSAETDRADAETNRIEGEQHRVSAEQSRSDAETVRVNNESARNTAEETRVSDESARKTAETSRVSAENTRDTSETKRVNAEISRVNAETARVNAENVRILTEQERATAESARVVAEDARVSAENTRAQTFAGYENRIAEAESTAQSVRDDADAGKFDGKDAPQDVVRYAAQSLSDEQQMQARKNIGAADSVTVNELKKYIAGSEEDIAKLQLVSGLYRDDNIVGLEIDYENKTFVRLQGATGLTAGSAFDVFPMYGGRKRCNVADDGTINAWFGDAGFVEDGSNGQVMVYQPVFYYMRVPLKVDPAETMGYHIRKEAIFLSDTPKTGFKRHAAFYDVNGDEIDYVMFSAYEASIFDVSANANMMLDEQVMNLNEDKLSSIAGAKPASGLTQQFTRPNVEKMANNRGDNWHGDLITLESANQILAIVELGMMDGQTAIESGVSSITDNSAYNCSSLTGSTSALGDATGAATSTTNEINGTTTEYDMAGKRAISYRGVENPFGNIWKSVYGINIHGNGSQGGGVPYVCTDFAFAESKNSGNYESAGFAIPNANGYISAMGYGNEKFDWLFMPSEVNGNGANSTLPVGDYTYITSNLNGYRIVLLGGSWYDGAACGFFYWCSAGVGGRGRNVGGRLAYVPVKGTAHNSVVSAWETKIAA